MDPPALAAPPVETPALVSAPRQAQTGRPRSTINLKEITAPPARIPETAPLAEANKTLVPDEVGKAWNMYAELQRNQIAAYQLLKREISLEGTEIVLHLANPFEEQLLQTIKTEATTFLRGQLQNNQITIRGNLIAAETVKMIYTNREKFEFLLHKHPGLKDLRDRFGLDADF